MPTPIAVERTTSARRAGWRRSAPRRRRRIGHEAAGRIPPDRDPFSPLRRCLGERGDSPSTSTALPRPGGACDKPRVQDAPFPPPSGLAGLRAAWRAVLAAVAFRALCYAAMTAAALWNELRPAPTLPDAVLARVPYVPAVANANWLLWLAVYLPLSLGLLWPPRAGSPGTPSPRGSSRSPAASPCSRPGSACPTRSTRVRASPVTTRSRRSGSSSRPGRSSRRTRWRRTSRRTSSSPDTPRRRSCSCCTCGRGRRLRWAALAGHLAVVASVFLAHLHYTIDVLGAYAVALAVFAVREGWPRPRGAAAGV